MLFFHISHIYVLSIIHAAETFQFPHFSAKSLLFPHFIAKLIFVTRSQRREPEEMTSVFYTFPHQDNLRIIYFYVMTIVY